LIVRDYRPSDHEHIAALHESRKDGLWLMDWNGPLAGPRVVAEEDGRILGAAVGRRTLEAFLTLDSSMPPVKRAHVIKVLLKAGAAYARALGYEEFHAPTADATFHEFLVGLPGFHKDSRHHAWFDLVNQKD